MIQNQVYLDNTYCFSILSNVLSVGTDEYGNWLMLEDNIFHPQGGGQPSDVGFINDIPIKKTSKNSESKVTIYLQSSLNINKGEVVELKIIPSERLRNAALHTAGHLLNWELRKYGWLAKSGHHFPKESRVIFSAIDDKTTTIDQLPFDIIEGDIRTYLKQGGKVETWMEDDIRISFINNTEPMSCAGTHVDNLNKIINFSITSSKLKKGLLRVSYDAAHLPLENDNVD